MDFIIESRFDSIAIGSPDNKGDSSVEGIASSVFVPRYIDTIKMTVIFSYIT